MSKFHLSVLILLTALFTASCGSKSNVSPTKNVTLIALRHADRDAGVDALNATGLARAAALPAALANYDINAIFSPGFHRNLQTASPLANTTGLEVRRIQEFTMPEQLAALQNGETVVWIGNKENLKLLWERINAPGEPPLSYGALHIVRFDASGQAEIQLLRFGPD